MLILVLLTNVSPIFKFLISKTMQLILNTNLYGDESLIVKEFQKLYRRVIDFIVTITNYFIVALICFQFTWHSIEYISIETNKITIFRC